MTTLEIAEWVGLLIIPAFLLLDLITRHKRYKAPRFARLRGLLVTVGIFFFTMYVGIGYGEVLGEATVFDGGRLGVVGGALVGVIVYEFVHYWYHRAVHRFNFLWRSAHQMHHSTESLDAYGAYFLHPLDAFLFTSWPILVFYPLLGLDPAAAAIAAAFLTFNAMFQHANIKTPRWLGYIIQRPESHSVHHQRGLHRYNYADLPLWDMVFGTFRNPAEFAEECGFHDGASTRIPAMLVGVDVSEPSGQKAAGVRPSSREPAILA